MEAAPPTTMDGITYTQSAGQPAQEDPQHVDVHSSEVSLEQVGGEAQLLANLASGGVQSFDGSPQTIIQKITNPQGDAQNARTSDITTTSTSPSSSHSPSHDDDEHSHSEHTKETPQEGMELPEQFQDRSPVQTPISYTQDSTKTNINSSGKRLLDAGMPTELDSNKMKKKNELLMNEANEKLASKIIGRHHYPFSHMQPNIFSSHIFIDCNENE